MGLSDLAGAVATAQVAAASLSGVLALVAVVALVRDRLLGRAVLVLSGLLELVLLVHLGLGVALVAAEPDLSAATYVGYLVGVLLVPPAAVWWSASERSRAGTAVVLVGALTVPFLLLRTHDLAVAAGVTGG